MIEMDLYSCRLYVDGKQIPVSMYTWRVLLIFVRNQDRFFTRMELLERLEKDDKVFDRAVDGTISKIRKALGFESIETVYDGGYRFLAKVKLKNEGTKHEN
jgi:DNA-binding response OmpR family regulator